MPRERSNSQFVGSLVEEDFAEVFVIYKNELRVPFKEADFEQAKLLGKGQQGTVYAAEVIYTENGVEEKKLCALKTLPMKNGITDPGSHGRITATQTSTTDDNTLKLMAILENEDGEKFALLPFCELFLTDITKELHKIDIEEFPHLSISIILQVMSNLLYAVQKMHEKGFSHSDIKLENIAYHAGNFCLIDMDCAHKLNAPVNTISGSPFFMHPACFTDSNFCAKPENDIYALGMVLKILLNDKNTLSWMQSYADKDIETSSALIRSISNEQSEKWDASIHHPDEEIPVILEKKLTEFTSLQHKLETIANAMTDIRVHSDDQKYQPGLTELIASIDTLKTFYFSTCEITEEAFTTALDQFYQSMLSKKNVISTPDENSLPSPNAVHCRASLFGKSRADSFLSNSGNLENSQSGLDNHAPHFKIGGSAIE